MRRAVTPAMLAAALALLVACGQSQASDLATRAARTAPPPTIAATPTPAIASPDAAVRLARTVVSPYLATWQDVVVMEDGGVWRVVFRNYDPLPAGTLPNDDYWRVPFSVFIDAATGIVLRQGYI